MSNVKIAITGATGLVGSHASEYLAKKGYAVRAIIRSKKNAQPFMQRWSDLGIEISEANINNKEEMAAALSGVQVVLHAAGLVDPYAIAAEIDTVNVEGSKIVLEAAINLKLRQFIFISSLSVITGNNDQYNTGEDAPLILCEEAYADSKVKAEQLVSDSFYKDKIAVTILRPGFIYGPRERAWLPQIIEAIKSGRAILVDGGQKQTNTIYVENLNKAIEASILNEKAYGQIYNLTDGQNTTKKLLFDTISDELDLPRIKKDMPSWLIKPIFTVLSGIITNMPLEKRKKLSRFSKAAYRLIGINQGFSIEKAKKDLSYINLTPFNTGMSETLSHFKQQCSINKDIVTAKEKVLS